MCKHRCTCQCRPASAHCFLGGCARVCVCVCVCVHLGPSVSYVCEEYSGAPSKSLTTHGASFAGHTSWARMELMRLRWCCACWTVLAAGKGGARSQTPEWLGYRQQKEWELSQMPEPDLSIPHFTRSSPTQPCALFACLFHACLLTCFGCPS